METFVCPVMINVNRHVMYGRAALIATSKDIVAFPFAFAFAAHVLTPPVLNADVYEQ
jgi:hypothetical protein